MIKIQFDYYPGLALIKDFHLIDDCESTPGDSRKKQIVRAKLKTIDKDKVCAAEEIEAVMKPEFKLVKLSSTTEDCIIQYYEFIGA